MRARAVQRRCLKRRITARRDSAFYHFLPTMLHFSCGAGATEGYYASSFSTHARIIWTMPSWEQGAVT